QTSTKIYALGLTSSVGAKTNTGKLNITEVNIPMAPPARVKPWSHKRK
ncbi:unnamed protein product, partial [Rotaria socialis]